jgi:hypothetical protein
LDICEIVLKQWQPLSGLVCVHSRAAVFEGVTGVVTDQLVVDAYEVALVVIIALLWTTNHSNQANAFERYCHLSRHVGIPDW